MNRFIMASVWSLAAALPMTGFAQGNDPKAAEHRKADIAKHRQMARAHEDAARCLEANEKESVCHARLQEACKGIAVGKLCGMRHDR